MKRVLCVLLALMMIPVPVYASAGEDDDSGVIDFILDGITGLFLPSREFLADWQTSISERFSKKFGGMASALGYLGDRLGRLREYRDIPGIFEVAFPAGTILHGVRMNVLAAGTDVLSWFRFCLTGVVVLATALACYHKVRRMLAQ